MLELRNIAAVDLNGNFSEFVFQCDDTIDSDKAFNDSVSDVFGTSEVDVWKLKMIPEDIFRAHGLIPCRPKKETVYLADISGRLDEPQVAVRKKRRTEMWKRIRRNDDILKYLDTVTFSAIEWPSMVNPCEVIQCMR